MNTTNDKTAKNLEKDRIKAIKDGKVAAPGGRQFARLAFRQAAQVYQNERKGKVAERTMEFETERLRPLVAFFGDKPLRSFKPDVVAAYQQARIEDGVTGRTVNMEAHGVLRRMLKRAKLYVVLSDYPKPFPEQDREIGRALPADAKLHLFQVAASRPSWLVAHCAAVLAANTTCRHIELRHLRWQDVDLFTKFLTVNRSKTAAGRREIPLTDDALAALARLRERTEILCGSAEPGHYVFPACENKRLDPERPQKSWRSAWRSLKAEAARLASESGNPEMATALEGFRFHDLRHQTITELAEAGAQDSVIQAIAGHMSKRMLDHYSHVRRAAKREAIEKLQGGLMKPKPAPKLDKSARVN